MKLTINKVSNHGTGNPAVARLTIQIFELIKFSSFPKDKQEAISAAYFDLHHRVLKCFEIKERLIKKANETVDECKKITPQLHAQQTPYLIDLNGEVESFLYETKNVLRDLTKIINEFFGTSFNAASNFCDLSAKGRSKITKWAEDRFGAGDALTKMLKADEMWIAEAVKKRNAVEHPGEQSGTLYIKNFQSMNGRLVSPYWYRNQHPPTDILEDIQAYYHNLLTFAEEIAVSGIEKNLSQKIICFVEIPENERNPESPIRFRADLRRDMIKVKP